MGRYQLIEYTEYSGRNVAYLSEVAEESEEELPLQAAVKMHLDDF